ncbi:DNA-directed RNA polymerase I subunit RPA12-like protein [Dinothrombium tinctorium]|uniref:DNA-directed RNA polymerase subunit n=1 Tax=Dinothrombium tinctorium TaxID=1965070 RepID=A0A3S3NUV7_9ACAR|nr:DNA-directed RNA polymerase I subunit RPA12-like protein [Dinothrombium tinctorium]
MTANNSTVFSSNIDEFCASCGSIMPLPVGRNPSSLIKCVACDYSVPISHFNGRSSTTTIVLNPLESAIESLTNRENEEIKGPVVERKCWKCGHEKMYYKTLQTRSADEGQTVFYYCVKCGAQENENS